MKQIEPLDRDSDHNQQGRRNKEDKGMEEEDEIEVGGDKQEEQLDKPTQTAHECPECGKNLQNRYKYSTVTYITCKVGIFF